MCVGLQMAQPAVNSVKNFEMTTFLQELVIFVIDACRCYWHQHSPNTLTDFTSTGALYIFGFMICNYHILLCILPVLEWVKLLVKWRNVKWMSVFNVLTFDDLILVWRGLPQKILILKLGMIQNAYQISESLYVSESILSFRITPSFRIGPVYCFRISPEFRIVHK